MSGRTDFSIKPEVPVIPVVPISSEFSGEDARVEATLVGDSVNVFPSSSTFPVISHHHLPPHDPSVVSNPAVVDTTPSIIASTTPATSSTTPATSSTTPASATRETPNIPALASSVAARIPTAEELKAHGTAFVDKTTELATQAKAQAGELVDPKPAEHQNETEAHLDNLTRGIAGMIVTAPLAGIEAISPVVADKLAAAQNAISAHLQHARDVAQPTAESYANQVMDSVKSFSAGGHTSTSTISGTTPAVSTGPSLTEKATAALTSAAQTAHSTATAYLPESITSKLPAPPAAHSETPIQTTTNDAALASPYVPTHTDKPTTALPSENFSSISTAKGDPVLVNGTGTGTFQNFDGLAPASTAL